MSGGNQRMSESRPKQTTVLGLVTAAGAVVCTATLCGFAGRFWWFFDLFSHFRLQYFLSLACILLLLLPARRLRAAMVLGVFAAVNLACGRPASLLHHRCRPKCACHLPCGSSA